VSILAEAVEVDVSLVEELVLLLLLLEEVHASVVDGSFCLVVLLYDLQSCPVVCLRITCVAWIAYPDAAQHLGLVVTLKRSMYAVIVIGPADLLVSGFHELRCPKDYHTILPFP
jgi:hypothetical protein